MRKILWGLLCVTLLAVNAQEKEASPKCAVFTKSVEMMNKGTKINHKHITALRDIVENDKDAGEVAKAKISLQDMNEKTKTRSTNAAYPKVYEEMKKSYEANCGSFTAENNATLTGMIDRSIEFNNILAKTLKDPLSISKVREGLNLQSGVEKAVKFYSKEMNNTAILLLVEKAGKRYKAAAGLADRESKRAVKTDDLFEIGSASKVFTGIAIFQLIEQGKLSLDTKLNTFYEKGNITKLANYKGKNYWDEVTVSMLLQHTSGFIDYLNIYGNDNKALKMLGGKRKHYTFEKLIDLAVSFGDANFKPGEKYKYCNTGYVILGDIISKVSGIEWRGYIQKNIMDKAGLKHTYFGTRIPRALRESMPKGYMHFKEVSMPMSLANAAGEIISNLDDLATLIKAWGTGKFYKDPKTLQIQLEQGFHLWSDKVDNVFYGYAIMKIEGFYGHGGQTFGFQSYMTINPKTSDVYVVGVNDSQIPSMNLFMQVAGIGYHFVSEH